MALHMLETQAWKTPDQFVAALNAFRLAHKGQWIAYAGDVCGKHVAIKNFDLWSQQIQVNGVRHGGDQTTTVKDWKNAILQAFYNE